ncbi:probable methyltransferase-like protein 25 isoform X2 [Nematostella vectensis]|uniref:probable methyltransferase-like protein 25 isoform X2 n=1 Tax=Nematostella vectensis TaxID=45351 RepID=UPI002077560C|nr:probable methyltransferase-like protein 25 isoform X2 [Nematostella vectensis]
MGSPKFCASLPLLRSSNKMADQKTKNETQVYTDVLCKIKSYLESKREIIDAHNVDFFTQNLWEKCLPEGLRNDLDLLTQEELSRLPSLYLYDDDENYEDSSCSELRKFLTEARSVQLSGIEFVRTRRGMGDGDLQMPLYMMTPKKSHEVSVMAHVVNQIASQVKAEKVLDLGSGKGYLSQALALDYGLTVTGVDSKDMNTQNAVKRSMKLLKALQGRMRKENKSHNMADDSSGRKDTKSATICSKKSDITEQTIDIMCVKDNPCGHFVHSDNKSPINMGLKSDLKEKCISSSYTPITQYVDVSAFQSGDLFGLSTEDTDPRLVLVGLHTCGDLAPTAIKLFIGDESVKALCLVGCCYHLLSQAGSGDIQGGDPGFPMSEYLQREKFTLSRNATMVAQQAADKIATLSKLPPKSVFYRAVLQVILKEKFQLDTRGQHVGRIGSKCKTFHEYVKKGLSKLGLPFHKLRASMAPSIESLFIIDRLCFMKEQGFHDSSVVCLFDPVKSPRCYAIIANKEDVQTTEAHIAESVS